HATALVLHKNDTYTHTEESCNLYRHTSSLSYGILPMLTYDYWLPTTSTTPYTTNTTSRSPHSWRPLIKPTKKNSKSNLYKISENSTSGWVSQVASFCSPR